MSRLNDPIASPGAFEPFDAGLLPVDAGDAIYWEQCGTRDGKPALVLHGGPGSGCSAWHRQLFDPRRFRVVLFDQRNCGRSTPHASLPHIDLSANNTESLIRDIDRLRAHLGIERWLVLGGSWGCTLGLAYAERYPENVSELVLFGVTAGRREEFDWLFRDGLERFFPREWERRRRAVPSELQNWDIVDAYHHLLFEDDPTVRDAAALSWCLWESASLTWPPSRDLAPRFRNREYALCFARIVTHYVRNNAWVGDGGVLENLHELRRIPTTLINGRFDFQAPISTATAIHQRLPQSELIVVDDAGHAADHAGIEAEIRRATDLAA